MKDEIAAELKCLGAAPFKEALEGVIKRGIQVFACGTCTKARGISDEDLRKHGANPMNKGVFVELIAESDNVVTY